MDAFLTVVEPGRPYVFRRRERPRRGGTRPRCFGTFRGVSHPRAPADAPAPATPPRRLGSPPGELPDATTLRLAIAPPPRRWAHTAPTPYSRCAWPLASCCSSRRCATARAWCRRTGRTASVRPYHVPCGSLRIISISLRISADHSAHLCASLQSLSPSHRRPTPGRPGQRQLSPSRMCRPRASSD